MMPMSFALSRRSASSSRSTSASGRAAVGSSRTKISDLIASARQIPTSERSAAGNADIGASGSMSLPRMASAAAAASRTFRQEMIPSCERG